MSISDQITCEKDKINDKIYVKLIFTPGLLVGDKLNNLENGYNRIQTSLI